MGYSMLDEQVTKAVADSIAQIDRLLASGRFRALAYSWDEDKHLGGETFDTAQVVRDHIVAALEAVAAKHNVEIKRSEFVGRDRDGDFNYMIPRQPEVLFIFNDNEGEFYTHYNDPFNPFHIES